MKKIILSLCCSLGAVSSYAQIDSAFKHAYDWIDKNHISLRKTFDGSAAEGKPASVIWGNDYENSTSFFTVDAALKISELSLLNNSMSSLIIYPKTEFHRDDTKGKEKNNLSGGINLEFLVHKIDQQWPISPFIIGTGEYTFDFVEQAGVYSTSGFLSLKGNNRFLPGSNTRDNKGRIVLRYYPYSGVEYYTTQNNDTAKTATMWTSRIFVELWPLPSFTKEYLQLTVDYTYRSIMEDNLYNKGDVQIITLSANFYPDGNGKIGFGVDYSVGEDPTNHFTHVDKVAFGIKVKL